MHFEMEDSNTTVIGLQNNYFLHVLIAKLYLWDCIITYYLLIIIAPFSPLDQNFVIYVSTDSIDFISYCTVSFT